MSALRQPDFSTEYYVPTRANRVNHQPQIVKQTLVSSAKVHQPKVFIKPALPKSLKTLTILQKGSFGLAIASMTASIGLYISTVNIPKLWSQEYQHLEDLQRQERQLIAINETIKYQIAKEAAQSDGLAISKPESAVFIVPAETKPKNQSDVTKNQSQLSKLELNSLGY